MKFDPGSSTRLRDQYYTEVFSRMRVKQQGNAVIAGMNFWAYNGFALPVPGRRFWKPGDDYMGDPPMEEQSLYGVYASDSSTWRVISGQAGLLKPSKTTKPKPGTRNPNP